MDKKIDKNTWADKLNKTFAEYNKECEQFAQRMHDAEIKKGSWLWAAKNVKRHRRRGKEIEKELRLSSSIGWSVPEILSPEFWRAWIFSWFV